MPPPPPPRQPPAMTDDAVGEIHLRLPPNNPASLVRAFLVCRSWRLLLSEPAFANRYRTFHQVPPLLGFLHNQYRSCGTLLPKFVSVTVSSPLSSPPPAGVHCCWALDCRHGCALIYNMEPPSLIVWDPITGDQKHVALPGHPYTTCTAAVLCAVDRCNHLNCSGGPFRLVFKGTDDEVHDITWVSVYSSETGVWSVPVLIHIDPISNHHYAIERSLLMGDAVYFTLADGQRVLKYDMGQHVLSLINLPPMYKGNLTLLESDEDGKLGIAGVEGYSLRLWWRMDPEGGNEKWVPGRVIELDMMLNTTIGEPATSIDVVGFAESSSTVFISSDDGIFSVETKSGQVQKIDKTKDLGEIFPYESFYIPGHADARLQE